MQLVAPRAVRMAVRMLMRVCRMNFQWFLLESSPGTTMGPTSGASGLDTTSLTDLLMAFLTS